MDRKHDTPLEDTTGRVRLRGITAPLGNNHKTKYHPGRSVPGYIDQAQVESGSQSNRTLPDIKSTNRPERDPITGRTVGGHTQGEFVAGSEDHVRIWLGDVTDLLQEMLVWTRAQIPSLPVSIDGPAILPAATPTEYAFVVAGKRVPALRLFVQNNLAVPVYFNLGFPSGPGGFQIPAGQILQVNDICTDYISLYTAAQQLVTGVRNAAAQTVAANISIAAWSNSEWMHMWGSI